MSDMYNATVINHIGQYLINCTQTLAVAESVTAGHLQAALSAADNASSFFQGGITTYTIEQKQRLLQVEPIYALHCNGVSQKISEIMAVQVCRLFVSDYGIGITGYAAPLPQKNIHHLFAWISFAKGDHIVYSGQITAAQQHSIFVQLFYTDYVLKTFRDMIGAPIT